MDFTNISFNNNTDMDKLHYYIRIESRLGYYAFYTVYGPNKTDSGIMARKQFARDFGGAFANCSVGYVWDNTALIDTKSGMAIDQDIQQSVLYD